jgi:hypothetical protein
VGYEISIDIVFVGGHFGPSPTGNVLWKPFLLSARKSVYMKV